MTGIVSGGQRGIPFDPSPYPAGASLWIEQDTMGGPINLQVAPNGFESVKLVSLTDPEFQPTPNAQQQWAFEANVLCDAMNVLRALATKMQATVPPGKAAWGTGIATVLATLDTAVGEGHSLCISTSTTVNTQPPQ